MIRIKKYFAVLMTVILLLPAGLASKPLTAEASSNDAVIREGSTFLLDFQAGTLQNGIYHDGSSSAFKFSGDTAHVALSGGQLAVGPVEASTVGVFDYGFNGNPTHKYDDFEISFDMTVTHRELNKQAGIQFQKQAWSDGWDSQLKTHISYDAKMNFFEGSTSIANTGSGKFRAIKDYGVPALNRDVLPWETFRVKQVVDGDRVLTYLNGSATPIVDVTRSSEALPGFVGVFANANVGFTMDNFLFNHLRPEAERDSLELAGDTNGFYLFIPAFNESVSKFKVNYQNITDNGSPQSVEYTGPRNQYVFVDGLQAGKDYRVELTPVYTSSRTNVDTNITMFKSGTVFVGDPLDTKLTVSSGDTFFGQTKQVDISVIGADQIRYTLDGSEPSFTHGTLIEGDIIFNDSIEINATTTLKAIALLDGVIKDQKQVTYTAGVNPVSLTNSAIFHNSQTIAIQSAFADSLIYTTDGTEPLYDPATDTALNGIAVPASTAGLTVTASTYMKVKAVRGKIAGAAASAKYTKVPLLANQVTDWDFTTSGVQLFAEEQDELYGKPAAPWSNLLGWDVNSDTGVWANHIDVNHVYRDSEGVHLFTTDQPIGASTSNPTFYLEPHSAGYPNIPSEYRYVSLTMKVNHTANAAIYFGTDAGVDTDRLSESRKISFRNTAAEIPEFQNYLIDMGEHAGWTGNITKLRIDPMATYPSMKDGIEIVVKEIKLLRKQDLSPEIRLTTFQTSAHEIVSPGDQFVIKAEIENIGASVAGLDLQLSAPDFLEITPVSGFDLTALSAGESAQIVYNVNVLDTGAGAIAFSVKGNGIATTRGLSRIFSLPATLPGSGQPDDVIIGNGERRLVFPAPSHTGLEGYGYGWLEAKRDGAWSRIAVMPSLGSVQEIIHDELTVKELYASGATGSSFSISFEASDGALWSGAIHVEETASGNLELEHMLQSNQARNIAAIIGPTLLLGEADVPALDPNYRVIRSMTDVQGDYINEALFPGLEWLDDMTNNNQSSNTDAVIDNVDAYRYVPHPRKITVPLMAVRKGELMFGLMWDARQKWDGINDQPSAFFGIPNRLERGEDTISTKLSLFIPSIFKGVNENATFATGIPTFYDKTTASANNENPVRQSYQLGANQLLKLQSELFVKEGTEMSATIEEWTQEHGLAEPLPYAHGTMQQESEAILTSFENLWSPSDHKWMNRIGPAATPMITSAFITPYALLNKYAAASYQNIAKQRVQTAMAGLGSNYSAYGYILPFYLEGITAKTMEAMQGVNVDSLISTAKLVNPADVTEGIYWDYETFIKRKGFPTSPFIGQLSDVTAGSNAEFLFKMLRHARLTGNENATTYGLAGLNYMNDSFTMPRGSQSWELRNMIPELGTAALAVRANVEAYTLTSEDKYLENAKLWAGRGLPFIYLWSDGSYGIEKADGQGGFFGSHTFMEYSAIASFGQSIYRSNGVPLPSTWFGRPVQWSGHDYGIALMELYESMKSSGLWEDYLDAGGIDYSKISEGLSVSGSRQTTAADSRYPTHLYDATSLLKWETSDYLYPNYQGAELLSLLVGERTNPVTKMVRIGTHDIRISALADIELLDVQSDQMSLRLRFSTPGEYTVFLQGVEAVGSVELIQPELGSAVKSFAFRPTSGYGEIHLVAVGDTEVELTLTSLVVHS